MLNRKYQTENATSDESITLMNVNNAYESIKNIMSYSILLQVINKSAIIFYQKNMSNHEEQLICYFKQAPKKLFRLKKNFCGGKYKKLSDEKFFYRGDW